MIKFLPTVFTIINLPKIFKTNSVNNLFFILRLYSNRKEKPEGLEALYWTYLGMVWIQCITTVVWVISIAKNRHEEGPTLMTKVNEF